MCSSTAKYKRRTHGHCVCNNYNVFIGVRKLPRHMHGCANFTSSTPASLSCYRSIRVQREQNPHGTYAIIHESLNFLKNKCKTEPQWQKN